MLPGKLSVFQSRQEKPPQQERKKKGKSMSERKGRRTKGIDDPVTLGAHFSLTDPTHSSSLWPLRFPHLASKKVIWKETFIHLSLRMGQKRWAAPRLLFKFVPRILFFEWFAAEKAEVTRRLLLLAVTNSVGVCSEPAYTVLIHQDLPHRRAVFFLISRNTQQSFTP